MKSFSGSDQVLLAPLVRPWALGASERPAPLTEDFLLKCVKGPFAGDYFYISRAGGEVVGAADPGDTRSGAPRGVTESASVLGSGGAGLSNREASPPNRGGATIKIHDAGLRAQHFRVTFDLPTYSYALSDLSNDDTWLRLRSDKFLPFGGAAAAERCIDFGGSSPVRFRAVRSAAPAEDCAFFVDSFLRCFDLESLRPLVDEELRLRDLQCTLESVNKVSEAVIARLVDQRRDPSMACLAVIAFTALPRNFLPVADKGRPLILFEASRPDRRVSVFWHGAYLTLASQDFAVLEQKVGDASSDTPMSAAEAPAASAAEAAAAPDSLPLNQPRPPLSLAAVPDGDLASPNATVAQIPFRGRAALPEPLKSGPDQFQALLAKTLLDDEPLPELCQAEARILGAMPAAPEAAAPAASGSAPAPSLPAHNLCAPPPLCENARCSALAEEPPASSPSKSRFCPAVQNSTPSGVADPGCPSSDSSGRAPAAPRLEPPNDLQGSATFAGAAVDHCCSPNSRSPGVQESCWEGTALAGAQGVSSTPALGNSPSPRRCGPSETRYGDGGSGSCVGKAQLEAQASCHGKAAPPAGASYASVGSAAVGTAPATLAAGVPRVPPLNPQACTAEHGRLPAWVVGAAEIAADSGLTKLGGGAWPEPRDAVAVSAAQESSYSLTAFPEQQLGPSTMIFARGCPQLLTLEPGPAAADPAAAEPVLPSPLAQLEAEAQFPQRQQHQQQREMQGVQSSASCSPSQLNQRGCGMLEVLQTALPAPEPNRNSLRLSELPEEPPFATLPISKSISAAPVAHAEKSDEPKSTERRVAAPLLLRSPQRTAESALAAAASPLPRSDENFSLFRRVKSEASPLLQENPYFDKGPRLRTTFSGGVGDLAVSAWSGREADETAATALSRSRAPRARRGDQSDGIRPAAGDSCSTAYEETARNRGGGAQNAAANAAFVARGTGAFPASSSTSLPFTTVDAATKVPSPSFPAECAAHGIRDSLPPLKIGSARPAHSSRPSSPFSEIYAPERRTVAAAAPPVAASAIVEDKSNGGSPALAGTNREVVVALPGVGNPAAVRHLTPDSKDFGSAISPLAESSTAGAGNQCSAIDSLPDSHRPCSPRNPEAPLCSQNCKATLSGEIRSAVGEARGLIQFDGSSDSDSEASGAESSSDGSSGSSSSDDEGGKVNPPAAAAELPPLQNALGARLASEKDGSLPACPPAEQPVSTPLVGARSFDEKTDARTRFEAASISASSQVLPPTWLTAAVDTVCSRSATNVPDHAAAAQRLRRQIPPPWVRTPSNDATHNFWSQPKSSDELLPPTRGERDAAMSAVERAASPTALGKTLGSAAAATVAVALPALFPQRSPLAPAGAAAGAAPPNLPLASAAQSPLVARSANAFVQRRSSWDSFGDGEGTAVAPAEADTEDGRPCTRAARLVRAEATHSAEPPNAPLLVAAPPSPVCPGGGASTVVAPAAPARSHFPLSPLRTRSPAPARPEPYARAGAAGANAALFPTSRSPYCRVLAPASEGGEVRMASAPPTQFQLHHMRLPATSEMGQILKRSRVGDAGSAAAAVGSSAAAALNLDAFAGLPRSTSATRFDYPRAGAARSVAGGGGARVPGVNYERHSSVLPRPTYDDFRVRPGAGRLDDPPAGGAAVSLRRTSAGGQQGLAVRSPPLFSMTPGSPVAQPAGPLRPVLEAPEPIGVRGVLETRPPPSSPLSGNCSFRPSGADGPEFKLTSPKPRSDGARLAAGSPASTAAPTPSSLADEVDSMVLRFREDAQRASCDTGFIERVASWAGANRVALLTALAHVKRDSQRVPVSPLPARGPAPPPAATTWASPRRGSRYGGGDSCGCASGLGSPPGSEALGTGGLHPGWTLPPDISLNFHDCPELRLSDAVLGPVPPVGLKVNNVPLPLPNLSQTGVALDENPRPVERCLWGGALAENSYRQWELVQALRKLQPERLLRVFYGAGDGGEGVARGPASAAGVPGSRGSLTAAAPPKDRGLSGGSTWDAPLTDDASPDQREVQRAADDAAHPPPSRNLRMHQATAATASEPSNMTEVELLILRARRWLRAERHARYVQDLGKVAAKRGLVADQAEIVDVSGDNAGFTAIPQECLQDVFLLADAASGKHSGTSTVARGSASATRDTEIAAGVVEATLQKARALFERRANLLATNLPQSPCDLFSLPAVDSISVAPVMISYNAGGFAASLVSSEGLHEREKEPDYFVQLTSGPAYPLSPGDRVRAGKLEFDVQRFDVGVAGQQGYRAAMEDEETVVHDMPEIGADPRLRCSFFGVYDGHSGRKCAQFLRSRLHNSFRAQLQRGADGTSAPCVSSRVVYDALFRAFVATDRHFLCQQLTLSNRHCAGCAVAVVVIIGRELWAANAGDARAVLCRNGAALDLTSDHKPNVPSEQHRIHAAGGFVRGKRILGRLAVSRALGDSEYKNLGRNQPPLVIAEPEVRRVTISQASDEFLLVACDGLFDVYSSAEAVAFLRRQFASGHDAATAAQLLVADTIHVRGTRDNVTVIIARFQRPPR